MIYTQGPGLTGSEVLAGFVQGVMSGNSGAPLAIVDSGAASCSVSSSANGTTSGGGGTEVSAGTITVTGGSAPIVLSPMAQTQTDGGSIEYYPTFTTGADGGTVSPGDVLTITASGSVVPAFSIDITVPNMLTFTGPVTDAAQLTVTRSADLTFTWTGGGAGYVSVALGPIGAGNTVSCAFAASSGSGTIPASLLAFLTPSSQLDAGDPYILVVLVNSYDVVTVADWTVQVHAFSKFAAGFGGVVVE